MSKTKTKKASTVKKNATKGTPGRKPVDVKRPTTTKPYTIADVMALNPTIKCRVTIDKRVKEWVKTRVVARTKDTRPTGGVGKPATLFQNIVSVAKSKVTSAPTPEVPTAPVEAPAAELVTPTAPVEVSAEPVTA